MKRKDRQPTAVIDGERYYKVLKDGRSFHGGVMEWSLPNGQPGKWHEVQCDPVICKRGIHLTRIPANWFAPGAKVYAVEVAGAATKGDGDKIAVSRCRLLRELDEAELAELGILLSGKHEVRDGHAWAYDSATVEAYESAMVRARDSATVRAYDSAMVQARGSAMVEAYGIATVDAYESATVQAYSGATVRAYDSAMVQAYGGATVTLWCGQPSVRLEHYAVSIDRRNGKPVTTTAESDEETK